MNNKKNSLGIVVISHGSPREEANRGFEALVERIALRLPGAEILPAFFAIARPDIADQVAALAALGVNRIVLMPYFLFSGLHTAVNIPRLLDDCRERFPQIQIDLLPTLEDDPGLENIVVERLASLMD